jgi:hypothetical protein
MNKISVINHLCEPATWLNFFMPWFPPMSNEEVVPKLTIHWNDFSSKFQSILIIVIFITAVLIKGKSYWCITLSQI